MTEQMPTKVFHAIVLATQLPKIPIQTIGFLNVRVA